MINRSPWLWNANKTAAGMTARTSNGIRILQGKRAPGMPNPSPEVIFTQKVAAILWPVFRSAQGFIREMFTTVPTGEYAANRFYAWAYDNAIEGTAPEEPTLQPAGLLFSMGTMTTTPISTPVADDSSGFITFAFPAIAADDSQRITDEGWYVIRNNENGNTISGSFGERADGGSGNIVATDLNMEVGDSLSLYISFRGAPGADNEGKTSNSVNTNTTVVA